MMGIGQLAGRRSPAAIGITEAKYAVQPAVHTAFAALTTYQHQKTSDPRPV
jgi:hypothetical protein